MVKMSPAAKTAIGLVLITVSILIAGDFLGMMPNEQQGELEGRKKFCESLAIQLSMAATRGEIELIESTLEAVVKRNPDVSAARIRTLDSGLVITAGIPPVEIENSQEIQRSSATHVQVPIFESGTHWGTVEVFFAPLWERPVHALFDRSMIGLVLFVALCGFVIYLLFIKKVMKELDPSVVPERVKSAFNVLAEGLLILDEKETIILANSSFADKVQRSSEKLFGRSASKLGWERQNSRALLPWQRSLRNNEPRIGVPLKLKCPNDQLRTFMVNSTPITDAKGKIRGALVTFDDMTDMEKHHRELKDTLAQLVKSEEALRDKTVELEYLATRDSLTGCLNRRAFLEKYEEAFVRAQETGSDLICVMIDLDHFKSINDHFGHTVGDDVLRGVAELLRANSRSGDFVGRYGGEEFCLILPYTLLEQGRALIERMRELIETESPKYLVSPKGVTASFGMAALSPEVEQAAELINVADYALYVAKNRGRNRVVSWNDINVDDGQDTNPVAEPVPAPPAPSMPAAPAATDEVPDAGLIRLVQDEAATTVASETKDDPDKYDSLTGLPGRDLFTERIREAIGSAPGNDNMAAVVSLDINTFKRINDALGYTIGDQLLRAVAERLVNALRASDTVAMLDDTNIRHSTVSRLNNDEFGILVTDLSSVKSITWIVKRIFDLLSRKFEVDGHDIFVTCNAGVSLSPHDSSDPETLIRNAGAARSDAKRRFGRNHLQFFSPSIDETAYREVWLESQLHHALEADEFELHYQPLIDLNSEKICAMEALLRWPHPKLGLVPPSEFIPIAEHTNLINAICDWVIRRACLQGLEWIRQGYADLRVTVNLSAVQFQQSNFGDRILSIVNETGLPCRNLELEITETTLMNSYISAKRIMTQLNHAGITFAIDDFGTGYSSLSSLKNLPVHCLKIDRSFLTDSLLNEQESMIVRAIVSMAHSLGLRVVAEGVETSAQRNFLHNLKCDEVQGYLYSKPVPPDLATKLLNHDYQIKMPASA